MDAKKKQRKECTPHGTYISWFLADGREKLSVADVDASMSMPTMIQHAAMGAINDSKETPPRCEEEEKETKNHKQ